jgi:ubiquinone/menaquinone biosynthesis C-methylase UbiE
VEIPLQLSVKSKAELVMNGSSTTDRFPYSWEQAIEILRKDGAYKDLIFNSYLTADLVQNCSRFFASDEFRATLEILGSLGAGPRLLDVPAGNGIATYAFAKANYQVTAVDPDPSDTVGRGAISHVLATTGLTAEVVDAFGEKLPFSPESFDVIYVRQGLHHAADLPAMLREFFRVLRPGGVLLACREHVVDDYDNSLKEFLDAQVDHQLYGGEHAFTIADYRSSILSAGFSLIRIMDPWDSVINLFPDTPDALRMRLLSSKPARLLKLLLPENAILALGMRYLRRRRTPGRLYSFVARKPTA